MRESLISILAAALIGVCAVQGVAALPSTPPAPAAPELRMLPRCADGEVVGFVVRATGAGAWRVEMPSNPCVFEPGVEAGSVNLLQGRRTL